MDTDNNTDILDYLKNMKFKSSLFGVSKSDVLAKMYELNNKYKNLIDVVAKEANEKAHSCEREYSDKIEAVSKTLISAQQQADDILKKAHEDADAILADAQRKAIVFLDESKAKISEIQSQKEAELKQLEDQKKESIAYLKTVRRSITKLIPEDSEELPDNVTSISGFVNAK